MELLQNAEFWIALALLALVAALVMAKVPAVAAKALDAHGERIQAELDEAKRLREEAQALLASLTAQREQAETMAKEMLETAKAEAQRFEAEAKAKLDEQIKRRAELAERRIATAEAQRRRRGQGRRRRPGDPDRRDRAGRPHRQGQVRPAGRPGPGPTAQHPELGSAFKTSAPCGPPQRCGGPLVSWRGMLRAGGIGWSFRSQLVRGTTSGTYR